MGTLPTSLKHFAKKSLLALFLFIWTVASWFLIINMLAVYDQYSKLNQLAENNLHAYGWKFHIISSTPANTEKAVEGIIKSESNDPAIQVTIYECDSDGDSRVDNSEAIKLANIFDDKWFHYEFTSLCGVSGEPFQAPYYWLYIQKAWAPLGGEFIGTSPLTLTVLKKAKFSTFKVVIIADGSTFDAIASCSKNQPENCTDFAKIAVMLKRDLLSLPYDKLSLISIKKNGEKTINPCIAFSLNMPESYGCQAYEFAEINFALLKVDEILPPASWNERTILISLTSNLKMANLQNFVNGTSTMEDIFIAGMDDERMYNNFRLQSQIKNSNWEEYEFSVMKLRIKDFEKLMPYIFMAEWLQRLVPRE